LFSKLNKHIETIFIDTDSTNFDIKDKVNVILSPSLYWIKKISLPVTKSKDVKPLLPSIFEDILPAGNYSYSAYKDGNEFLVFAYEDKKILELIKTKGISQKQLNNIYFAQNELSNITKAMKINETQSIYVKDGIVVLLPCCWIKEHGYLNLNDINLSKKHINLKQYNYMIDDKSIYTILILCFIFTIFSAIEYGINLQNIDNLKKKKDEVFQQYSLKPTMFQNNSLLSNYKKINKTQTKLRDLISTVLSLRLPKTTKITLIDSNKKKLIVHFKSVDINSKMQIESQLKNKNYLSSLKKDILSVEFKL